MNMLDVTQREFTVNQITRVTSESISHMTYRGDNNHGTMAHPM